MMKRVLFGLYGVVAYRDFLGTFLYAIGFVTGFGVPKILDAPHARSTAPGAPR